jgi:hypothetical protein
LIVGWTATDNHPDDTSIKMNCQVPIIKDNQVSAILILSLKSSWH